MADKPKVLFYFLHLLGVGHVFRAKRLVEGMMRHGIGVDVIYGGQKLPNVTIDADSIHYLSPIRATDNSYETIHDANGQPLDKPFQDQRCREILKIFDELSPDIILTEAYPFGRRMVRHELQALLDASQIRSPRPLVVSSVRDILQERRKARRIEETCTIIDRYFDRILVHSDPEIIKLDATFPLADQIRDKIGYTGFVVPQPTEEQSVKTYDVLVSAGGGAFGGELMSVAMDAAHQRPDLNWCLSCGPNLPQAEFEQLLESCPSHVQLVRYLPNLSQHMKQAGLSISQCGYNTAMDALSAHGASGCRAIFVPYDTLGQSEQLRRAQLLEDAGYGVCVPQSVLTPQALLDAMDRAKNLPTVNHDIDFDGANNTALQLLDLLETR